MIRPLTIALMATLPWLAPHPAGASPAVAVRNVVGSASGFSEGPKHGLVRFSGQVILVSRNIDLSATTATVDITALLYEYRGAGELAEGVPLPLIRRSGSTTLAIFETPPGYRNAQGFDTFARVQLTARPLVGRGVLDFQVDVSNLTFDSFTQCPRPNLTFSFTVHDGIHRPAVVRSTGAWRCSNENRSATTP